MLVPYLKDVFYWSFQRPLNQRTRTRFDQQFFLAYFQKLDTLESFILLFFTRKVNTVDNFFPTLPDDMFSRQNDAGRTCTVLSIQKMSEILSLSTSSQNLMNKSKSRVLSRIYRFGEKSRVAEGHELPRGVCGLFFFRQKLCGRGCPGLYPPEFF